MSFLVEGSRSAVRGSVHVKRLGSLGRRRFKMFEKSERFKKSESLRSLSV